MAATTSGVFLCFLTLTVLAIFCFRTSSTAYVTRCEVKAVNVDETANITCDFPQDLSKSKTSFGLYCYEPNRTVVVLVCHWDNETPVCFSEDGATSPQSVTYKFTTSVRVHKKGNYSCETSPRDDSVFRPCNLTNQEGQTAERNHASTTKSSILPTKTIVYTAEENEGKSGFSLLFYLSLTTNVLLLAIIVSIVIIVRKRRSTHLPHKEKQNMERQMPLMSKI